MSCHITFHYIMSCHVTSRQVRSRQVMSSHVTIMLSNPIYSSAKSIASTGLAADATELSSSLSSSYVENAGASSASLALTFIKLLDMMPLSFIWVCPTWTAMTACWHFCLTTPDAVASTVIVHCTNDWSVHSSWDVKTTNPAHGCVDKRIVVVA